jgi:protein TonB
MSALTQNPVAMKLRELGVYTGMVVAAVVVNAGLFALAGFLTTVAREDQDIIEPVGVSLVNLAPPEPPKQEEVKEPEPPPPAQEKPDFTPDLVQPAISGPSVGDLAIGIDIGGVAREAGPSEMIFDSVDLDQAPQAMAKVPPAYPYKARERGIEGYVAVKFMVREDGSVGNVNILKAKPEGYFEEEVRRALLGWKFQPGQIGGEPVASWVVTTLRFDLN